LTTKTVYLSLGSNIGDRARNLQAALEQLGAPDLRVVRTSPAYETEPVEYTAQRWFLNLVAEAGTELLPMQLLLRIGRVERALGRVRTVPKGPRTIDIDILFYGRTMFAHPERGADDGSGDGLKSSYLIRAGPSGVRDGDSTAPRSLPWFKTGSKKAQALRF